MSAPAITIRQATASDAALLARMGSETFSDAFGATNTPENLAAYLAFSFSPSRQAAELADPAVTFFIAELDDTPVGYAQLRAGQPPAAISGSRPIELVRIYAARPWIGHGVGAALMQSCIEQSRTLGYDVMWLGVWEHNPRARAFYRRWGFADVGTHIFQLGDDPQIDLLMERRTT